MNPWVGRRPRRTGPAPVLVGLVLTLAAPLAASQERADVLVADFEGEDYGGWAVTGEAFGRGPARGALPGQMEVSGFLGHGLVNSFHGGDAATGTLTSPEFTVARRYLNVLIGGGHHPGETDLNLLVGGAVVRTATGPNEQPGGTERLEWASWDVAEFAGKAASLRVVDRHTGGWGHISIDHVVQSDRRRGLEPVVRDMVVAARYLHLPVRHDAPTRRVRLEAGGRTVHEFDVKLAEGRPDFRVFTDLAPLRGARLKVEAALPAGSKALEGITQADEVPDARGMYHETDRPQFHFTARRGWLNDPNGLVWHDGEYHLFFQHNPYGWDWGNMHWGHAVSPDLVHWTELPEALTPRRYGDWCFSGSAVVDRENTSGFGKDGSPPMVAAFTSTGRGECVVFSNDRGRTWAEFAGNPVVAHQGRDPRLLRHGPTRRWVMAVYDETGGRKAIAFHFSPDLKAWTRGSAVDGFYECPDLFELPVAGEPGRTLWVLHAADGAYLLGRFDGRTFTPEYRDRQRLWYGNFYAAQTFSDTPGGRRVQVGWGQGITFPGMPFNQQMTVPVTLSLRRTDEGVRMFALPVAEIASVRVRSHFWRDLVPQPGGTPLASMTGDLFEVRAEAEVDPDGSLTINARGTPIVYDARRRTLSCGKVSAPLAPEGGVVRLHALVDRGSVEVFGNGGRVAVSLGATPRGGDRTLAVTATGAATRVRSLEVDELKSAWRTSGDGR